MSGGAPGEVPPSRGGAGPWVMALVRLGAGWLVAARPLALLAAADGPVGARLPLPARLALAAALGLGAALFAWPPTCLRGLALLLAGLAGHEFVLRTLGLPPTPHLERAAAILAVLAAGEWLTRRLARR